MSYSDIQPEDFDRADAACYPRVLRERDEARKHLARCVAALERIANHETRSDRRKRGMVDVSEVADLQRIASAALAAVKE